MLMNGHCSHLKHFTFGRAVTKLAAKLAAVDPVQSMDTVGNVMLIDGFVGVSRAALFDGDGAGDDEADDNDGDDDFVDGCVESESLVVL